jgi:hypothetical protein
MVARSREVRSVENSGRGLINGRPHAAVGASTNVLCQESSGRDLDVPLWLLLAHLRHSALADLRRRCNAARFMI